MPSSSFFNATDHPSFRYSRSILKGCRGFDSAERGEASRATGLPWFAMATEKVGVICTSTERNY
jgi:hypothetical protein